MNSSTSSFKGTEWKVIAAVILAILLLEITSRLVAAHLNFDRTHIHEFPELVAEMKAGEKPRVLAYGNSLVLHGLDEELLARELTKSVSAPCSVTKIAPTGTVARDWSYLYDTYFTEAHTHPEVVVVGFVSHHLTDQGELKMRRLARHFCSSKNFWACLREETGNVEERAVGVLSRASAVYGDQQELQWSSIHAVIPEYTKGVRKINRFLDNEAERLAKARAVEDPASKPEPDRYRNLTRLIAQFNEHGVRSYFVAMPQPHLWSLDPVMIDTLKAGGATFLDARAIAGLTEADFSDGYHLGETGAEKFTRFLTERLARELTD